MKEYDIVRYGDKAPGFHKHHGVWDAWAEANIPGYVGRDAPAILLNETNHLATYAVERQLKWELTGRSVGRAIDWTKITPHQVEMVSEMMFKLAKVPAETQAAYYRAFHQYIYSLHPR